MKVGFAGLGRLGHAIATRLKSQGVDLTVWNRDSDKSSRFDAPSAATPAELAGQCDVIFLCLFDSDAVDEVLNGDNGLLSGDCEGKAIIDTTTNHFERVKRFHRQAADRGAIYLEAPVLGSVVPASQGKLVVVVSGDHPAYEQHKPLLDLIGEHVFYLPAPGLATRLKLINNMLLGAFMGAIGEALVLAESAGISKQEALEILAVGGGKSGVLGAKKDRLLNDDFSPHFTAALIHKDLRYLEELADAVGADTQLGKAALSLYDEMMTEGRGLDDFCAIYDSIKTKGAAHR